jgi:hypothetical protein
MQAKSRLAVVPQIWIVCCATRLIMTQFLKKVGWPFPRLLDSDRSGITSSPPPVSENNVRKGLSTTAIS